MNNTTVTRRLGFKCLIIVTLLLIITVKFTTNFNYTSFVINFVNFLLNPIPIISLILSFSCLITLKNKFRTSKITKEIIFDNLQNPVVVVSNNGEIIAANTTAQKMLSFTFNEPSSIQNFPVLADMMVRTLSNKLLEQPVETIINNKDFEVTVKPIIDTQQLITGYTFVFFEITSYKERQNILSNNLRQTDLSLVAALKHNRQISDQILVDSLTGLLNRRSLPSTFGFMAASQFVPVFAAIIDIDYFKAVNDRLGHSVGDKILIQMGKCLHQSFRADDKIFRLGGEEFLILCTNIELQSFQARIINLQKVVATEGMMLLPPNMKLTFSAGIGSWPIDAINMSDLLEIVDKRLYEAKESGRNRVVGPLHSQPSSHSINRPVVPLMEAG